MDDDYNRENVYKNSSLSETKHKNVMLNKKLHVAIKSRESMNKSILVQ